jgi:hypothetical protein
MRLILDSPIWMPDQTPQTPRRLAIGKLELEPRRHIAAVRRESRVIPISNGRNDLRSLRENPKRIAK